MKKRTRQQAFSRLSSSLRLMVDLPLRLMVDLPLTVYHIKNLVWFMVYDTVKHDLHVCLLWSRRRIQEKETTKISVVRVQASTLNVGSDVTIQRSTFLNLRSCNVNHLHIFFWVALFFPNVSIIPWTCNYNSPIRISKHVFKIFHFHSTWRSNLGTLISSSSCFHRLFM